MPEPIDPNKIVSSDPISASVSNVHGSPERAGSFPTTSEVGSVPEVGHMEAPQPHEVTVDPTIAPWVVKNPVDPITQPSTVLTHDGTPQDERGMTLQAEQFESLAKRGSSESGKTFGFALRAYGIRKAIFKMFEKSKPQPEGV